MPGEKTEKATPKRRSDERKKGNVFQSKDITSVATLVASFLALSIYLPGIINSIIRLIQYTINSSLAFTTFTIDDAGVILGNSFAIFLMAVLPLLMISILAHVLISGLQTRFIFSWDTIKFKGERINIIKGFGKLFSLRSIFEIVKSILKISFLGLILYLVLSSRFSALPKLMDIEFRVGLGIIADTIMNVVWMVGAFFAFISVADYAYQWYEYEKNIKMSKQDIKDEYKQLEGDPYIKGKIKERQRMMSQRRMMQEVPKADIIIRNPTHYAIAIKYEVGSDVAPKVIAKGMDNIALKIILIGQEHKIHTVTDKPLARSLYENVEIDEIIPEKFYHAVAELLAFVYKMRNQGGTK
jgi:flagellar biosynthetic protein FlhB